MNLTQFHLPLYYADAANSMWHEVAVFGIGIVSFIIIMAYAVKDGFHRRPHRDPSGGHPSN